MILVDDSIFINLPYGYDLKVKNIFKAIYSVEVDLGKKRNYLQAFKMRSWSRMPKIWITNEVVLRRLQENRSLISNALKRKANWIGHILRRNGLLHDILEGKMEGGNASRLGRRRIQILDDLKNGKRYWELKEEVENREGWRTRFRVHT